MFSSNQGRVMLAGKRASPSPAFSQFDGGADRFSSLRLRDFATLRSVLFDWAYVTFV